MHTRARTPGGPGARSPFPIPNRTRTAVAAAVAVVATGGCGSDHQSVNTRPLERPELQRTLVELTRDGHSAAVALVQTEAGIWHGAADSGGRRTAAKRRFAIASTTKTFVATVILQLAAEGRLSLDDRVKRWLPGLLPDGRTIRVRQLLNHTSGLPNDVSSGLPPRERAALAARQGSYARPGTAYAYSNVNYVVLGLIAEKVTGRRLGQVVRDRIFRPLDLDDTSYGTAGVGLHADRIAWLGTPEESTGPVSGEGGIVSTTADLASFFQALFAGELLNDDRLSEMMQTVEAGSGPRAGLGVFRFQVPCGFAWGHGGVEPAYSTMALAARDGSKVVVVAETGFDFENVRAAAEEMYCA
jgi:D-alanyl-D-alanine carboxypeptidase